MGRQFDNFELLEEIGSGGMGVVYRARQLDLGRVVAFKMIRAGSFASAAEVQRFRAEAEAAATLDHPNIVPIHEIGETEGCHYFTMKFIDGASLAETLKRRSSSRQETRGNPSPGFDSRRAAELMAVIARAVHHAHQRGILHRDLKPGNILLDQEGQPHVADFGLAKRVEGGPELTLSGAVMGTPGYMSPEQAEGRTRRLTTATDVFSLGAILYHLLTGRAPFEAETPLATIRKVVDGELERPSALCHRLDRDLETICLKCLEPDPSRRYASASALAEDLERFLRHEPVTARPVGLAGRTWRWCRRKPHLAALSGAVLILLLALAIGSAIAFVRITQAHALEMAHRQIAERNERHARSVSTFLEEMFGAINPVEGGGASYTVKQLLEAKEQELDARFAGQPQTLMTLRKILGRAYQELHLLEPAQRHLSAALKLKRELTATNDLETAGILEHLGYASPRTEEQKHLAEALAILLKLVGEHSPDYLRVKSYYAGSFFHTPNARSVSERIYVQVLATTLGLTNLTDEAIHARIERDLARCGELWRTGQLAAARAIIADYNDRFLKSGAVFGDMLLELPVATAVLARRERDLGHTNTVEPLLMEAMDRANQLLKPDDPRKAQVCMELAQWLRFQRRDGEALRPLRDAWTIRTNKLEMTNEHTVRTGLVLGDSLLREGQTNAALALLGPLASSHGDSIILCRLAAREGCDRSLRWLMSAGFAPPTNAGASVLDAVLQDDVAILEVLLDSGITQHGTDSAGRTALHLAANHNATNALRVLVNRGANVNAPDRNGFTALHWAASSGSSAAAAFLLDRGAAPLGTTPDGSTALHVAARRDHPELIHLLIRRGISVDDRGTRSSTPLHDAAGAGGFRAAAVLLQSGASVSATNRPGTTPLHLATRTNSAAFIQLLMEHRADPNAPDGEGRTPLHYAAVYRAEAAVRALLKGGANRALTNRLGQTALDLARERRFEDIAALLQADAAAGR